MSILRKIIYSILSFQEKILTKKLQKTLEIKNSSKRKQIYNKGCFLSLDSIADSEKNKMEEELSLILKTSNYNPLEVLEYIKSHGTEVFFIEKSNYLSSIGENEGLINTILFTIFTIGMHLSMAFLA
jgi:hypothetical protein